MRGQAVHEERVLARDLHHVRVHLPVFEVLLARLILGFESHARPDVGGHQVRALCRLHRIGELLVMAGAVQVGPFGLHFVAGRRGHVHVEVEHLRGLQPGVADVVRVADPRHGLAADVAAMLDVGVDVGQDLAGMVFVGEAVDHRHARTAREALDDVLLEGADHHDVAHARDHLRGVLHRLAAARAGNRAWTGKWRRRRAGACRPRTTGACASTASRRSSPGCGLRAASSARSA